MKKYPIANLSLLGLLLMGVSAVTAAILPKKSSKDSRVFNNGIIALLSNGSGPQVNTCMNAGPASPNCDYSVTNGPSSTTTHPPGNTSADVDADGTTGTINTGLDDDTDNSTFSSTLH